MTRYLTPTEKLERKIREVDVEITQLNVAHYAKIQKLMKQRLKTYLELEKITQGKKEKP
jgi:hypothetical protein